jgi:hypothetical protein
MPGSPGKRDILAGAEVITPSLPGARRGSMPLLREGGPRWGPLADLGVYAPHAGPQAAEAGA